MEQKDKLEDGGTGSTKADTDIYDNTIGSGSAGTSYSGGSGSGAAYGTYSSGTRTQDAGANGGAGSAAKNDHSYSCGGGAGNPGGAGRNGGNGETGTGGLLIIYSENIINSGTINSNGSKGGTGTYGGGSSGGGSINIFYRDKFSINGTIKANGGQSVGSMTEGGAGGNGAVSIGSIATGTYRPLEFVSIVEGNGTKNDPYIINNAFQMQKLNTINTAGVYIKLGNDIDLGDECSADIGNWTPIGTEENPFKGEFDGNGKTILNLYIADGTENANTALFQYNEGTIKNLTVSGEIFGTQGAAGIVYQNNKGIIENCVNNINITNGSISEAAGIVSINDGIIRKCINKGNILASTSELISSYAGIAMANNSDGIIEECTNEGIIQGYNAVGGIAAYNEGIIKKCINKETINGDCHIGGIVGHNIDGGRVYNSYNVANVTGRIYIGGIAGSNGYSGKCYIYNCYSINATDIVGGTDNSSIESNCYTSGMTAENLNSGIDDIQTNENKETPWQEDIKPNINYGYPILKWQME